MFVILPSLHLGFSVIDCFSLYGFCDYRITVKNRLMGFHFMLLFWWKVTLSLVGVWCHCSSYYLCFHLCTIVIDGGTIGALKFLIGFLKNENFGFSVFENRKSKLLVLLFIWVGMLQAKLLLSVSGAWRILAILASRDALKKLIGFLLLSVFISY